MPTVSDYDARRGSARERGYTVEWDKAALFFRRQHPLCLGCEAVGRITATEVVDHVVPHKGDMVLFWDQSRWQPACRFHHDVVKQQLELMFARGAIAEADLWLNSSSAIAITKRERSAIGADGWPIER
jgi:5-methylcytosine-specific restriction endonuclease McrA